MNNETDLSNYRSVVYGRERNGFSRKIRTYSKPTIQKISDLTISVQRLHQVVQIVEESETEEEVVEKLNSLSK